MTAHSPRVEVRQGNTVLYEGHSIRAALYWIGRRKERGEYELYIKQEWYLVIKVCRRKK